LFASAFFILLVLITSLIIHVIRENYNVYENELRSKINHKVNYLDNLILELKKQVDIITDQLQYYSQFQQKNETGLLSCIIQNDSSHFSMDDLPDSLQDRMGAVHGYGDIHNAQKSVPFIKELNAHLATSSILASIYKQYDNVAWVYALSGNHFINLFPYLKSGDLKYNPNYHDYDIFKMGKPSNNPEKKIFITPAYLDAGGAGLMISIGKPYYLDGRFGGVCGVDVTLNFISRYINENLDTGDEIFIMNSANQILGHTRKEDADSIVAEQTSLYPFLTPMIESKQTTFQVDGRKYYLMNFHNTDWVLVFSTRNISPLFLEVNKVFFFLILLMVCVVSIFTIISFRYYISPAKKLTQYIEAQSGGIDKYNYSVPPTWRYWFAMVGNSFQRTRDIIKDLDNKVNEKTEELRKAYEDLKIRTAELQESNVYKDRIFSVLSHDLRASLSSLISIQDMLQKDYMTPDEFLSHLKTLGNDTKKVKFMMENLLQWSIRNLNSYEVNLQKTDIGSEIENVTEVLSSLAANKRISFITIIDENTNTSILTDKAIIELVLRNLLMNAIKFSCQDSEIKIIVTRPEKGVIIDIKDAGIGIPEETRAKLFQTGQGIRSGTRNERGTGLGLYLCREFLEKMGGKIWFESEVGVGTTFSFFIPEN